MGLSPLKYTVWNSPLLPDEQPVLENTQSGLQGTFTLQYTCLNLLRRADFRNLDPASERDVGFIGMLAELYLQIFMSLESVQAPAQAVALSSPQVSMICQYTCFNLLRRADSRIVDKAADSEVTFINLPPELHLEIFKLLDDAASICLGIACKKLYSIHHSVHGKVTLYLSRKGSKDTLRGTHDAQGHWIPLVHLIQDWMAPKYLSPYSPWLPQFFFRKFLAKESYNKLVQQGLLPKQ